MIYLMASEQPAARNRRFREVLYEALAGPTESVRDAGVAVTLRDTIFASVGVLEAAGWPEPESLSALRVAALATNPDEIASRAENLFGEPPDFAEAIFLARCLGREAEPALGLLRLRTYIEKADVPPVFPELQTDRQAVLDSTTFAALWRDPSRLAWMESIVSIWRRDYAVQYVKSHTTYNAVLGEIAHMADDVEGQARALGRLNQLSRLGPPAGLAALERLDEMRRVFPCVATPAEVDRDVATTPQCGTCAFALSDHATRADARLTVRAIERALKTQLSRLSLRLVSRILARPQSGGPEKLEQFLRVVQASDLEGLASILDDSLLAFVADLLASDEGGENVLADLSLAYPTVTAANLEAALGEFRRLLLVRFAAGQEAVPLLRAGA